MRLTICLWIPRQCMIQANPMANQEASLQVAQAANLRHPVASLVACMPGLFNPHSMGMKGWDQHSDSFRWTGIARELAALRLNARWVLNSARTQRGMTSSHVVSRGALPSAPIESSMIFACINGIRAISSDRNRKHRLPYRPAHDARLGSGSRNVQTGLSGCEPLALERFYAPSLRCSRTQA